MDTATATPSGGVLPRILVVDDSRMVRASIAKHLKGRFDLREEIDGEAGWEALLADPEIRVVISDLGMPKLDGFGLLERIRNSDIPRIRNVPAVVISGDEDQESRDRARQLGASDFITKGTSAGELVACCESLMALAQPGQADAPAAEAERHHDDSQQALVPHKYFVIQGGQALSLARRNYGEVNVLALTIGGLDGIRLDHGEDVVKLVVRKLAKILRSRVRREDAITHVDDGRFAVLSAGVGHASCVAFALSLKEAVGNLNLSYKGLTLKLSLTVGLANFPEESVENFETLYGNALSRLATGVASGGNCVVGMRGVIVSAPPLADLFSVERALQLLREGKVDAVRPHLGGLMRRLLPLLDMASNELPCPLPLTELARACEEFSKRGVGQVSTADGAVRPKGR